MQTTRLLNETVMKRLENTSLSLNSFQKVIAGYSTSAVSVGMYFSVFSRGVAALKGKFKPRTSSHCRISLL